MAGSAREWEKMRRAEAAKARAFKNMRAEGIDDGSRGSCTHPKRVKYDGPDGVPRVQYVACGRCKPCMFRKENTMVGKALCEAAVSDHVWFVTLTIADEFPGDDGGLPRQRFLRLSDAQAFLKRLRAKGQREGFTFRYILAGEYGGKTGRAHWHLILFIQGNAPKLLFQRGVFDKSRVFLSPRLFRGSATKRRRSKPGFGFEHVHIPQWPFGFVQIETQGVDQAALRYVAKYVAKGKLWAWSDAPHLTERDDAGVDRALADHWEKRRGQDGRANEPHFSASTRPALGARYIFWYGEQVALLGAPVLQQMALDAPNSVFTARGGRDPLAPLRFHLGGAARRELLLGFCYGLGVDPLDLPNLDRWPEGVRVSMEKLHYWREARAARATPRADRAAIAAYVVQSPFATFSAIQKPVPNRGEYLEEWLKRSEGRHGPTRLLIDPRAPVDLDEFRFFDPARGEFLDTG